MKSLTNIIKESLRKNIILPLAALYLGIAGCGDISKLECSRDADCLETQICEQYECVEYEQPEDGEQPTPPANHPDGDQAENDTLERCFDADHDGYYSNPSPNCEHPLWTDVDCDDHNQDVYPHALEIPDGVDNQCPGDFGYGVRDEEYQPGEVCYTGEGNCQRQGTMQFNSEDLFYCDAVPGEPDCGEKECGSDGCGSTCGECDSEDQCLNSQCQTPRWQDLGDDTVKDNETGLIWQNKEVTLVGVENPTDYPWCPEGICYSALENPWPACFAIYVCNYVGLNQKTWRLPTYKQLQTLLLDNVSANDCYFDSSFQGQCGIYASIEGCYDYNLNWRRSIDFKERTEDLCSGCDGLDNSTYVYVRCVIKPEERKK